MPQRLAYTKTQRIYHIFWRAALKHHQKVQIFGDKDPLSLHWRPQNKDLKELIFERYKDEG